MNVMIWHNILWSRYKAGVFSELYRLSQERGVTIDFVQIAETDSDRAALSPVDLSLHKYPYKLLFQGAYSSIPPRQLYRKIASQTWGTQADLVLLDNFSRLENWLQFLILTLRRKRYGLFCDSTHYDRPQTLLKSLLKRIIFTRAAAVFCYGQRAGEYIHFHGVPPERIFTRCQSAALPADYDAKSARARRAAEAAPPTDPRYLYVGRLAPEKSLDTLIRAFAKVLKVQPKAKLVLVGRGPEEDNLKALTESLDLKSSVEFAGAKHDDALVSEYARATCLVLPSKSEPWGLVVNEALSYGCPVVVSHRCGCVPELVVEGVTGFAFEWGNVGDMTKMMLAAYEAFLDVDKTAKSCISHVSKFSPEAAARAILDGCEKLFGS